MTDEPEGIELRNAKWNRVGTIDVEINNAAYGWMPTTADPNDVCEKSRAIYQLVLENPDVLPIAPYVPPTVEEARLDLPALTARQLRLGLLQAGIAPSGVTAAINALPAGSAKERALIEWEYATTFDRSHELLGTISAVLGLTPENIDAMWVPASLL